MIYSVADRKRELLELIASDVELEVYNPYTVLSEQLDGKLLSKLIATVSDVLKESFDGIIVIHGTDTLQYSAAALSLAYADSKVPIVLVSSNYTLDNPKANGRDNLKYAVEFVKETIGGVFVSYRNLGQNPEIHLGSRVLRILFLSHPCLSGLVILSAGTKAPSDILKTAVLSESLKASRQTQSAVTSSPSAARFCISKHIRQ